jgi:hypothetical protein
MAQVSYIDSLGMQELTEFLWIEEVGPEWVHLNNYVRQRHQYAFWESLKLFTISAFIGILLEEGDVLFDWSCIDAIIVDEFFSQEQNVIVGIVSDEIGQ